MFALWAKLEKEQINEFSREKKKTIIYLQLILSIYIEYFKHLLVI